MAREIKSKKYAGVYYRDLDNGDRSYFLRVRLGGGTKRIPIGKRSEGITEAFCNQEKARIVNAHRFGDDVARQLQRVKADEPTFTELIDYYIQTSGARESTIKNLNTLKAAPFATNKRVTIKDVQDYMDSLKPRLRASTINQRMKYVRMVMRFAIRKGKYRFSDPTDNVDLIKTEAARQRYLTPDEVRRLLDATRDKKRMYIFVKMALCTGARLSTLIKVHERDINPDGSVRLHNTKTNRYYTGYLDEETMHLIDGRKGYIFARRGSEYKEPSVHVMNKPLQKVLNELFNPEGTAHEQKVLIHTLRHSVATQQLSKGVPLEVISKTLDHSSIVVTSRIYAKVAPELVRRSVHNLWD